MTNPSVRMMLACDLAVSDNVTGRVSAINILDHMRAERLPALMARLSVLVRLDGPAPGTWYYEIAMLSPTREVIAQAGGSIVDATFPHSIIGSFGLTPLRVWGEYGIEFKIASRAEDLPSVEATGRTSFSLVQGVPAGFAPTPSLHAPTKAAAS